MQGKAKGIIYLAVAALGVGFLLIVLGWNGAASIDYAQGQLPFVISGGVGGMALVAVGLTLMVLNALRSDLHLIARKLDELIDAAGPGGRSSGPTIVPDDDTETVVAGRTTYHRTDCHLVEGRSDLQVMSQQTAYDRGLAPCRVCEPDRKTA